MTKPETKLKDLQEESKELEHVFGFNIVEIIIDAFSKHIIRKIIKTMMEPEESIEDCNHNRIRVGTSVSNQVKDARVRFLTKTFIVLIPIGAVEGIVFTIEEFQNSNWVKINGETSKHIRP